MIVVLTGCVDQGTPPPLSAVVERSSTGSGLFEKRLASVKGEGRYRNGRDHHRTGRGSMRSIRHCRGSSHISLPFQRATRSTVRSPAAAVIPT